ncbi:helix-turn-helix domain-containing protein [Amphibacillus sediminis]|uniref:helix-turn-helix domain-containing protein n=1 Tax=Amphibacillus sediminis TaxID=360185 RepID=UPI00082A3845|nr:helix-turn-helix domain-containing protein [Amphibacillus sediminis]
MVLNTAHIFIVNRLQELKTLRLDEAEQLFKRSSSSIYRYVQDINDHLPAGKYILINDLHIVSNLQYDDYIAFTQSLTLENYAPSQLERFQYLLVTCFLEGTINLTKIYNQLGLSLSTKKKDRKGFEEYLSNLNLVLESTPGMGVSIVGDEFQFRIRVSQIVSRLIEVSNDGQLYQRKANNPIERDIYKAYFSAVLSQQTETIGRFLTFLSDHHLQISYPSKKYLIVYVCLASYRMRINKMIERPLDSPLLIKDYQFSDHFIENAYLNMVIGAQDYKRLEPIRDDRLLRDVVYKLIEDVEQNIITSLYKKDALFSEVYSFLYKITLRNLCRFDFFDDKLIHAKAEYTNLFHVLKRHIKGFESTYFPLNDDQLATLVLIFRHHIMKNKLSGRNTKKIIIVTNSAKEITNFFIELLKQAVDIEVIDSIHINELELLQGTTFDYLITFSNRISAILNQKKYNILKLNYFIKDSDINYLLNHGFSDNARRKLLAQDFVNKINQIDPDKLSDYLTSCFPDYFL